MFLDDFGQKRKISKLTYLYILRIQQSVKEYVSIDLSGSK